MDNVAQEIQEEEKRKFSGKWRETVDGKFVAQIRYSG